MPDDKTSVAPLKDTRVDRLIEELEKLKGRGYFIMANEVKNLSLWHEDSGFVGYVDLRNGDCKIEMYDEKPEITH